MNFGYIYKTTNLVNNKIYIGMKSGNFNSNYYGSGIYFKSALKKYGKDNFILEVLIYANNKDELCKLEKQYIKECREKFGKENLYNITDGGEGNNYWLGKKRPDMIGNSNPSKKLDVREKISKKLKGRISTFKGKHHTEESKEKSRLSHLGKIMSEESKEKNRLAHLGKPGFWLNKKFNYNHCEKIRIANVGNKNASGKRSEEIKKKMLGKAPTFKGKHHTEESKEKNRLSHLGKIMSEESKEKMRIAAINRWQKNEDFNNK